MSTSIGGAAGESSRLGEPATACRRARADVDPGVFAPEAAVVATFVLASLALNLTPGLDMTYVVGITLRWRTPAGVCAALGIGVGSLCHMVLAAAGLSALVAASPVLMTAVTLAGAGYLVWAGVGMMRSASPPPSSGAEARDAPSSLSDGPGENGASTGRAGPATVTGARPTLARVTLQGALINLLNVKVIIFYLSFIPQFVRPDDGPVWQQVGFFGLLFNLLGTSTLVLMALLTGSAARRVLSSPRSQLLARRVCGAILVLMALVLTSSRLVSP